jgi:AraC-like DNA-binding protein
MPLLHHGRLGARGGLPRVTSDARLVIVSQRFVSACQSANAARQIWGAMQEPSDLNGFPMASGGLVRLACRYAAKEDLEIGSLLKKAGLTFQQIDNPAIRLKVRNQIAFLNLVADAVGDELLGFHLAQDFDLREIGMLYYIMSSADALGDALQRATRYGRMVNEGLQLTWRENEGLIITFEYIGVARHQDRHQIEFFMVSLVRLVRQLSGLNLFPERVDVTHHRGRFHSEFKKFFGCEVAFGSGTDEIAFPATVVPMPLASADSFLGALLIAQIKQTRSSRLRPAELRITVENEIVPLLPHGNAQAPAIARKLGMSQRTLARRLASEGLSFTGVLDELRRDLAQHYLSEADVPVTTVAWLLGYQEVSAFSHAFKRWTGTTPKQVRMTASR